jgi:tRNA(Ile)-lysidine synthase
LTEIIGGEAERRIVIAHFDHGLRDTSRTDAAFVRGEAERRGLALESGREEVSLLAGREKLSIEDAARRARYAFLTRTAAEIGARAVALGHTADDQAETVLLNIFRGSGLRGVAGMPTARDAGRSAPGVRLVRPLLSITREEIEEFLKARGVPFREDETNRALRFRRNRIRHEILPGVRRFIQPRATEVLVRLAELAREGADFMEAEAASRTGRAREGEGFTIPREAWDSLPGALRGPALIAAFRAATGGRALLRAHVEAILGQADSPEGGDADLPAGWRARAGPGGVSLLPPGTDEPEEAGPWSRVLAVPGRAHLPDGRLLVAELREPDPGGVPPRERDEALPEEWADYDRLGRPGELAVRSRKPGDGFRPLGAPGEKSVKRFLIDLKVPRAERGRVPIVTTPDGRIVWVAPFRLDERARVTEGTRTVLALRLT